MKESVRMRTLISKIRIDSVRDDKKLAKQSNVKMNERRKIDRQSKWKRQASEKWVGEKLI